MTTKPDSYVTRSNLMVEGFHTAASERMRHEIMLTVKANGLEVTGDFWLMLIFRSESELRKLCHELNIRVN